MPKRRNVPTRTCICCGVKTNKRDLLRIVSVRGDRVVVDITGKQNGRGAYICVSCRDNTGNLRRDRLEYSLRTKINDNDWLTLIQTMTS
jgi:predicted RNA-binding protein YlxR (DUF448 family)